LLGPTIDSQSRSSLSCHVPHIPRIWGYRDLWRRLPDACWQAISKGAAGKIVSFQKVKVVDPDTLEPVPLGEPGELLVSSENMVTGYWNKPEETSRCFVNIDGRLWYRTGDIVKIDEDGWLYFIDRCGDIIKHKGYRVAASKVERVLQEHPAVMAASVVGVPDPMVGERIKAFVVLKEDVRGVNAYELIRFCRERLAAYEVPHYIEFRDALPKSKVGKILRRELRAIERKKLEKSDFRSSLQNSIHPS